MLSKFLLILIAVASPHVPGPHSPKVQLASMATEVDAVIYNRVFHPRFGGRPKVHLRQVLICRRYLSCPKPLDEPNPRWVGGLHVAQYVMLRDDSIFRVEQSGDKWFITFNIGEDLARVVTKKYKQEDTLHDLEQLDLLAVPLESRVPYSLLR